MACGLTKMRTSRPALMAYDFSMPLKLLATFSSSFMRSTKFSAEMLRAPGREALIGVDNADDQGFDAGCFDVVVVLFGSQGDFFGGTVLAQHLTGNVVVLAFHFVRQGFAEVVDQGGVLGGLDVGTDFFGDHAGDMGHFS